MTITYANGTALKAIMLSREEDEIRAIPAGSDDVLAFTRVHGTWISEDIEPVTIEFEWQRGSSRAALSEDVYICPMELTAHLIHTLFAASEDDEPGGDTLYLFNPQANRAIQHA
jgi:hypothetical protein